MIKRILPLLLVLLAAAAVSPAAAPLADRLPAGSLAYVGWAGVTDALTGSSLGQLAQQPGFQKTGQAVWDLIVNGIAGRESQLRQLFDAFPAAALKAPCAAALTRLDMGQHGPDIAGLALVDLGPARQEVQDWLKKLVAHANDHEKWKSVQAGQADYWTQRVAGAPIDKVAFGFYKDLFFIALGEEPLAALLQLTPEKSLAASDAFKAALADVDGADVQLAAYADVGTIVRKLVRPDDQNATKILRAIGLADVTTFAGSVRVVDKQLLTKARLSTPGPHRGILTILAGKPLRADDLAGVPADADLVLATTISPAAVLETFLGIARQVAPRENIDRELKQMIDETGVDVPALLACLGDSVVLSSAASQGGFVTGTILSVAVKDEPGLKEHLAKVEQFLQKEFGSAEPAPDAPPMGRRPQALTVRSLQAGAAQVRYVQVVEDVFPVAPAWTVHQGRLYVALWPQALQAVLDKPADDRQAGLASTAAFRTLRAKVSADASCLAYVNLPGLIRRVYPLILGGWTAAANALPREAPIDALPEWLPPLPVLEKLLSAQICAVSSDDKGITMESYGPLPAPAVVAAPAAVLAGFVAWGSSSGPHEVMGPVAMAGGGGAREMNDLRQVVLALIMYANDNADRLPDSLDDEKLGHYVEGKPKEKLKGDYYVYCGKGIRLTNIKEPLQTVLVYSKSQPGVPTTIVGFADGHVEKVTPERLAELLKPKKTE